MIPVSASPTASAIMMFATIKTPYLNVSMGQQKRQAFLTRALGRLKFALPSDMSVANPTVQ
jgi:hypothetical protein